MQCSANEYIQIVRGFLQHAAMAGTPAVYQIRVLGSSVHTMLGGLGQDGGVGRLWAHTRL